MSDKTPTRRAAYGPNSPALGSRGVLTRNRLMEAALVVFARQGYQGTRIEDIALQAAVSRATIYQYFDGKEAVFRELANEAGRDMLVVTRRIDGLGPTEEDWQKLRTWLAALRDVFDRYATVFVQWQQAQGLDTALGRLGDDFMGRYTPLLAKRLQEAGLKGLDPLDTAVAVLAMVERFNFYRHTRGLDLTEDELLDGLTSILQEALFRPPRKRSAPSKASAKTPARAAKT